MTGLLFNLCICIAAVAWMWLSKHDVTSISRFAQRTVAWIAVLCTAAAETVLIVTAVTR